jgi:hypothetical protein
MTSCMKNFNFPFRPEELLLIADNIKTSYVRDKQDFIKFSPDFWDSHHVKFEDKLKVVFSEISKNIIYRQLDEMDSRIGMITPIISEYLNQLNVIFKYVNLKILIKKTDSVFQNLHYYITKRDSENLVLGLRQLKQSMFPYIKQLEDAGFDHGLQAELDAYISILNAEYVEKNILLAEFAKWEERNSELFNEFWAVIFSILETGQKLYQNNSIKLEDYTLAVILSKVKVTVTP